MIDYRSYTPIYKNWFLDRWAAKANHNNRLAAIPCPVCHHLAANHFLSHGCSASKLLIPEVDRKDDNSIYRLKYVSTEKKYQGKEYCPCDLTEAEAIYNATHS